MVRADMSHTAIQTACFGGFFWKLRNASEVEFLEHLGKVNKLKMRRFIPVLISKVKNKISVFVLTEVIWIRKQCLYKHGFCPVAWYYALHSLKMNSTTFNSLKMYETKDALIREYLGLASANNFFIRVNVQLFQQILISFFHYNTKKKRSINQSWSKVQLADFLVHLFLKKLRNLFCVQNSLRQENLSLLYFISLIKVMQWSSFVEGSQLNYTAVCVCMI